MYRPVEAATFALLGLLGAVACGPTAPGAGESTGDTSGTGGADPTSGTDPTTPTSTPTTTEVPECQSDGDCDPGYCGYCLDGMCIHQDPCCYDGVGLLEDGRWRCLPPLDCYEDIDCDADYMCEDNFCVPVAPIPVVLPVCDAPDGLGLDWNLGEAPSAFVLADVDLDLDLDLVAAQPGSGRIELALNDGAGQLTVAGDVMVGQAPDFSLAAGDMDNDGDPDLVLAAADPGGLRLLLNDGAVFTAGPSLPLGRVGGTVRLGDFDGDGTLDVVMFNLGDGGSVLRLGDGMGGLHDASGSIPKELDGRVAVIDIGADGIADLIGPTFEDRALLVFAAKGDQSFFPLAEFTTTGVHAPGLVGDLDQQGDGDVVAVQGVDGGGLIEVWPAIAPAAWSPAHTSFSTSFGMDGGVLAEIDADAGLDLIAATGSANILVALGDGQGGFTCQRTHDLVGDSRPELLAVGDLDGDGRNDIVAGSAGETAMCTILLE